MEWALPPGVEIREVEPGDASELARICFEAFGSIHDQHNFPRDFPSLEAAAGLMSTIALLVPLRSGLFRWCPEALGSRRCSTERIPAPR